jgi:hypothetical protein
MLVIQFRDMSTRDPKVGRDKTIRIVVASCGLLWTPVASCGLLVPAVVAGTREWGWPVHQALVETALLMPIVAYVLMRLWFRHQGGKS